MTQARAQINQWKRCCFAYQCPYLYLPSLFSVVWYSVQNLIIVQESELS